MASASVWFFAIAINLTMYELPFASRLGAKLRTSLYSRGTFDTAMMLMMMLWKCSPYACFGTPQTQPH